ncbi:hypothetical protein M422DRAFT_276422 [Sphaerobolus stellatus SS14]|uniref:Uncharacterized protein n=1 Tax=Sphaerobolus stellatus (strain SS14) TaxID=990650 RepID=A0A0C9UB68_SPHS4|nr:hypothetical protein M422DRAFT_276751 [Sphaerobolus stellatus SS14]KIJ23074.1 hypothetical protein M422DRAFT_276422 [Sphaerobolus stellatus SS14]
MLKYVISSIPRTPPSDPCAEYNVFKGSLAPRALKACKDAALYDIIQYHFPVRIPVVGEGLGEATFTLKEMMQRNDLNSRSHGVKSRIAEPESFVIVEYVVEEDDATEEDLNTKFQTNAKSKAALSQDGSHPLPPDPPDPRLRIGLDCRKAKSATTRIEREYPFSHANVFTATKPIGPRTVDPAAY